MLECAGRSVDEKIMEEIRGVVPKEKFGHRKILWDPIYIDTRKGCLAISKQRGNCENGYDCVDASLKAKKVLDKYGEKSSIFRGIDEDGLFGSKSGGHFFVVTDETHETIDAVPFYPLRGAKNVCIKKIPDENLKDIENNIFLSNPSGKTSIMLDFQERESYKYLVMASVKGRYLDANDKQTDYVRLDIIRKDETLDKACIFVAAPNEKNLRTLLENGLEPIRKDCSTDEAVKRLEKLESENAIKVGGKCVDISLRRNKKFILKHKDYECLRKDLEEIYMNNIKEFVHIIEAAPLV